MLFLPGMFLSSHQMYRKTSIKHPFIINNAFSMEGDGRLLEATLFGNVLAIIYRI